MTEHREDLDSGEDLGEPVGVLRALSVQTSSGFTRKLMNRLERRKLTGQAVELSWNGLFAVFRELLVALVGMGTSNTEEGKDHE